MAIASTTADVCLDTCVFVNFAIVSRVELMVQIGGFSFHVPQEVVDEVTVRSQKLKLEEVLSSGALKKASLDDVVEVGHFARYSQRFGKGESACLAIAGCRGWVLATDETKDRRLKREIEAIGVRVVNTPGLLVKAIHQRLLSVDEADSIKAELERNRFKMDFHSFQQFAGGLSTRGTD